MTTIVSRLYESAETARRVADRLRAEGFPDATLSVVAEADKHQIAAARVDEADAARYASAMTGDRALFVCRAPFTPFGAARRAMEVADGEPSVDAGVHDQNRYIREVADLDSYTPSVLENHPLMLTREDYVGSGWSDWQASDIFMWPTVTRRKTPPNNVIRGGAHMSRYFWPQKLVSTKPRKSSVFHGGRHMSRMFWPMPLVRTPSRPKRSVLGSHPRITERLGWKALTDRRR